MSKQKGTPLISPGWSHYILTAPLSPKAHVSLTKKLRALSEQEKSFSPLGSSALNIGIMDLGVLPTSSEWMIIQALKGTLKAHASLKLQSTEFRVSHPQLDQVQVGKPAHLWLEFRDRLGALSALYSDLAHCLQEYAPNYARPVPQSWLTNPKFVRENYLLLCGRSSHYKTNTYEQKFTGSAWINEVKLQKRPSHYVPYKGYQSIWTYPLPIETPPLSEVDELEYAEHSPSLKKARLSYPLEGEDLSLLQSLEERLELTQIEPLKPKTWKHRQRRRKKRTPSNQSNSSQEKL